MDSELPLETRMLRDVVRRFVDEELIPIEASVPADSENLPPEIIRPLQEKARSLLSLFLHLKPARTRLRSPMRCSTP